MDNQQERLFELGWLVAMIEGEGNISISWNKKKSSKFIQLAPRIQITNSDWLVLEKAQKIINSLGVGCFIQKQSGGVYHLLVCGMKRCNSLLMHIKDYMLGKRERAEILYEFTNYRLSTKNAKYTTVDKDYFLRMRRLNNKAIVPEETLNLLFELESSTTTR